MFLKQKFFGVPVLVPLGASEVALIAGLALVLLGPPAVLFAFGPVFFFGVGFAIASIVGIVGAIVMTTESGSPWFGKSNLLRLGSVIAVMIACGVIILHSVRRMTEFGTWGRE